VLGRKTKGCGGRRVKKGRGRSTNDERNSLPVDQLGHLSSEKILQGRVRKKGGEELIKKQQRRGKKIQGVFSTSYREGPKPWQRGETKGKKGEGALKGDGQKTLGKPRSATNA